MKPDAHKPISRDAYLFNKTLDTVVSSYPLMDEGIRRFSGVIIGTCSNQSLIIEVKENGWASAEVRTPYQSVQEWYAGFKVTPLIPGFSQSKLCATDLYYTPNGELEAEPTALDELMLQTVKDIVRNATFTTIPTDPLVSQLLARHQRKANNFERFKRIRKSLSRAVTIGAFTMYAQGFAGPAIEIITGLSEDSNE